jgi:calcineurin-like phosphoesterase family protein
MSDYYFTSDTHFNHYNIMRYCKRPFDTVEEMNETIIKNWNDQVSKEDFVYHLGDFGFGPLQNNQEIFSRLNGKKYLIRGNHDNSSIKQLGWMWVKDTAMIKVYDQYIWLSHYPHRTWNRARHGAWHLFGHIHNLKAQFWLSFNAGVDAWGFKPLHYDLIAEEMESIKSYRDLVEHPDYHEEIPGEFGDWEEEF